MRVLVACEYSGIVRDAFRFKKHDAYSCDFKRSIDMRYHIVGDVLEVMNNGTWDLMIAHPPCTHLSVSGAPWFKYKKEPQRKAVLFFMEFTRTKIPKIAIENPVGVMSRAWRKPDQIIQPWQFGHDAQKTTCLWLKGLPKLKPTKIVKKKLYANQTPGGHNKLTPSKYRSARRSKTFIGIAEAMAEQWG